jgi:cation:H+ antiporter
LSLLGALGANIPNYAASIVAISGHEMEVGLGIIIGSNIYNMAIILGIVTFAVPQREGIVLKANLAHDVYTVALYTLTGMVTTLCGVWLLPGTPLASLFRPPLLVSILLTIVMVTIVALFGGLSLHALRRTHHDHDESLTVPVIRRMAQQKWVSTVPLRQLLIWIGEALLALVTALGAVVVMVQAGQSLTLDLHMPKVLAGLLVLAVATSLPNTIVAFILARTDREASCVEEIFSSNSINATLGIAVPLLFWHSIVHDQLLLWLDAPLMVVLTLAGLLCVVRRRVDRIVGALLLLSYVVWVIVHVLL